MHKVSLNKQVELLGKEFDTTKSGKCFVIDYKNSSNVLVAFYEPLCFVKTTYSLLRRGKVKNPLMPHLLGVGLFGIGKYGGKKDNKVYRLWSNMLVRAYDHKFHKKQESYKDVTVCKEWLNFQNFAEWYYSQKHFNTKDDKGRSYQLDKDILIKGNKIYSPETCCFVPHEINSLLLLRKRVRGKYPIGVSYRKQNHKFDMCLTHLGQKLSRSYHDTPEEAFQAYKEAKELCIKEVANKWKDKIDDKVYQSLLNYEVSIED